MLKGLFGSAPLFQLNDHFRVGLLDSLILPFTLDPSVFETSPLWGCTLKIYPFSVEIDLWDAQGDVVNYLAPPLDKIGVDFEAIGEGARQLADAFGLRRATKATWPVMRMDNSHRGFPFLHMDLL